MQPNNDPLVPPTPQPNPQPQGVPEQTFHSTEPTPLTPGQVLTPGGTITQAPVLSQPPSDIPQQVNPLPTPVIGMTPTITNASDLKHKRPKQKLLIVIAALTVAAGLAAFIFLFYLPNQPSYIYKTGVNRSGKALDKLVRSATEKVTLDAYKKSNVTLGIDVEYGETSYKGNFDVKYDASKTNGALSFSSTDSALKQDISANFKAFLPQGSDYPDVYFQINGLKALGYDSWIPGIANYDGKWIAITADYFKSIGYNLYQNQDKKTLTTDDYPELARTAMSTTVQYVFSTKSDTAVFANKKFIGKVKEGDVDAAHYQVALNKTNGIKYCKALVDSVYSTNAYKKLPWVDEKNIDKNKESSKKDCDSSFKGVKDDAVYDLWVDLKYKLIYKIRIPSKDGKDHYTEVGQVYKGGNDISVFVKYHDGPLKSDARFSVDTNLKTSVTTGTLTYKGSVDESAYDIKVSLTAKPYTGEIDVSKPADSVSFKDVLKALGLDENILGSFVTPAGNVTSKARDTERMADVKSLHAQLEARYAFVGMYPTLANMNSDTWRSQNMKGVDSEALKDPNGTIDTLAAKPGTNVYSYEVTTRDGKACDNVTKVCDIYTLTATLEDGTKYIKTNLQ